MGSLASALQGIGAVGEDAATGKQLASNQRQIDAFNNLNLLISKLKLQQLQEQIRQAGLSQSLGFTTGPNGSQVAISRDPNSGEISTKQIVPGYDPEAIQKQAGTMISSLPESFQPIGKGLFDMYASAGDPQAGVKALGSLAEKVGAPGKKIDYKTEGDDITEITDAQGKTWDPNDPNLPPELGAIVQNYKADSAKKHEQTIEDEARKTAEAINRAIKVGDASELRKNQAAVLKTAQRGISGHTFFKTVQAQVENAERTGGQGTTAGDMLIVESFMQLMFGIDPKALRGSPKMMETMMKQGGVDDRVIGYYNTLLTGGKLSQDVRNEMLDDAKEQLNSWDSAVTMTGQLTDDPKSKSIVDHYLRVIGADTFNDATPPPPPPIPGAIVTPK